MSYTKPKNNIPPRFYDLKAIIATLSSSRSTILKMVETGQFPKPIQLFNRRNMWPDHEVEKMVNLLASGMSKEELAKRVIQIEEQRKELAK